ncbi:MAG: glycosyltransferase family 39 protein [Elusimicrobiota bacterium]
MKAKYIILSVIILGAFIRFIGISIGMPDFPIFDEPNVTERALRMGTGDLNPHWFANPSLWVYLNFAVFILYFIIGKVFGLFASSRDFALSFFKDPSAFYILSRSVTAVFGTLAILPLYSLIKRCYDQKTAYLSILLFAVNPLLVQESHFAKVDIPMLFFLLVSMIWIMKTYEDSSLKNYVMSGILIGLAVGTKYSAVVLYAPLFLAHIFSSEGFRFKKLWSPRLLLGIAVSFVVLFLTTPFMAVDTQKFVSDIIAIYKSDKFGWSYMYGIPEKLSILYYPKVILEGMTLPALLFSIAGAGLLFLRRINLKELILYSPAVLTLLILAKTNNMGERFALPLIPFLLVLASIAVLYVTGRFKKKLFELFIILILVLPALLVSLKSDLSMTTDSTITIAKTWILANIPEGSRIIREPITPELIPTEAQMRINLSKIRKENPKFGNKTEYILKQENVKRYNLKYIDVFEKEKAYELNSLLSFRPEYIILSSEVYKRFKNKDFYPIQNRFYAWLEKNGKLEISFESKFKYYPTILVYRIKKGSI